MTMYTRRKMPHFGKVIGTKIDSGETHNGTDFTFTVFRNLRSSRTHTIAVRGAA